MAEACDKTYIYIHTFLGYTHIPLARKCGWQIDSELVF